MSENTTPPPLAEVITEDRFAAFGSVLRPVPNACENCGNKTAYLFNIGTTLIPRFVCYTCKFQETRPTAPPHGIPARYHVAPGDHVMVYDSKPEMFRWFEVAEVKIGEQSGRQKIRVAGVDYFFDIGIVADHERRAAA